VTGVAVLLLLPLLAVDVPPVLDYPNHLARMVVLAFGPGDPVLSRIYAVHWDIIPNLAIDLVVPGLLHILPVHVAGRLALAAALLLPGAGLLAYHRALFRDWSLWPVASGLVAYNSLFLLGFMNFLIATGAAFFVAAAWLLWRGRYPVVTGLLCSAGAVAVFFCHLSGVMLLAILVGGHEAERLLRCWRRRGPVLKTVLASAGLQAMVLLPAAVLYRLAPFHTDHSVTQWSGLSIKLTGLLQPVLTYNPSLDLVTAILILAFIGLCLRHRRWDMPASSIIVMVVLLGLYAATPFAAKGGAWIDARFSVTAGFMLFAGCRPRLPRWAAVAAAVIAVCLLLARIGMVATVWASHRVELAQLRASIAPVMPGSRVLVVRVAPEVDPEFWTRVPPSRHVLGSTSTEIHAAALLLIERHAFWPLLFATPSQQPVTVLAPYHDLAFQLGMPPDYRALVAASTQDLAKAPYLADWRHGFDDVLVLDAEGVPDLSRLLPGTLERVNETGFAALYRVNHGGVSPP
jgi:hypothetical protein